MEPVKATILMATYNGQNFIEEQIKSINSQVGVQSEIFFSDDGSIDDTKKILAKYKNCFDLTPKNLNCGSAANFLWLLNKAASQDLGQYVFLSDQDDIWLPSKMQSAISILEDGYDCYSGSYFLFDSSNCEKTLKYVNKNFDDYCLNGIFRSPGPGYTYAFKREAFLEIVNSEALQSFYPHTETRVRWHDWLIFLVALQQRLTWFIDRKAQTLYRQHENNDTGQLTSIKQLWHRIKYVATGAYFNEVILLTNFRTDKYSGIIRTPGIKAFFLTLTVIFRIDRGWVARLGITISFIVYRLKISRRK